MTRIPLILKEHETAILNEWLTTLKSSPGGKGSSQNEAELREQARLFLNGFQQAVQSGNLTGIDGSEWRKVRELLQDISSQRARQGYSPTETATFIFSLKQPLFQRLQSDLGKDPIALGEELWTATALLDQLGLFTIDAYQKSREELIIRQQQEMVELSTPVIQLWKGILALPLIGTLDSARTQVVMETLLQRIVETGSAIAIIDITGVPTVDTMVAQHLMKTVSAARLMGADCLISGIRPQIAQTMVHLGVALGDITTKATLAGAFASALHSMRLTVADKKA
ncbi:MAG TPA: STAS domain-containing protein [Candidatus Sulfopaludibacter sp.]|jgi:rsbT co-antagonist protein RsbR|nr:STAS domain-containing protein [Candidatus Sulfopaludibacter sp.]